MASLYHTHLLITSIESHSIAEVIANRLASIGSSRRALAALFGHSWTRIWPLVIGRDIHHRFSLPGWLLVPISFLRHSFSLLLIAWHASAEFSLVPWSHSDSEQTHPSHELFIEIAQDGNREDGRKGWGSCGDFIDKAGGVGGCCGQRGGCGTPGESISPFGGRRRLDHLPWGFHPTQCVHFPISLDLRAGLSVSWFGSSAMTTSYWSWGNKAEMEFSLYEELLQSVGPQQQPNQLQQQRRQPSQPQ